MAACLIDIAEKNSIDNWRLLQWFKKQIFEITYKHSVKYQWSKNSDTTKKYENQRSLYNHQVIFTYRVLNSKTETRTLNTDDKTFMNLYGADKLLVEVYPAWSSEHNL